MLEHKMLIPTLRDVDAAGLERNLKNAFLTISQSMVMLPLQRTHFPRIAASKKPFPKTV